jgi:CRISPR-associated protein Csd2
MSVLDRKIDFAVILKVENANPNGDPLNGNRPRIDYDGRGEISDVCLKRKIRDRLQERGFPIFVQSDDRKSDGLPSLKARAESAEYGLGPDVFKAPKGARGEALESAWDKAARAACAKWLDVRTFGQLFAFSGNKEDSAVSIPIRGPVTLRSAFSLEPVNVSSLQITKSVSGEGDGTKRSSDTMGLKHRVDSGTYLFYGSMNPQLAERTGFSYEDALAIKEVLPRLFENDASSARPEGSMYVEKLYWWEHDSRAGQYSSAKVHRSLRATPEGVSLAAEETPGLKAEIIDGF